MGPIVGGVIGAAAFDWSVRRFLAEQMRETSKLWIRLESLPCAGQLVEAFGQMAKALNTRLRRSALQPCQGILQAKALSCNARM